MLNAGNILYLGECSPTKQHMRKFNEASKDHFNLFLKECEWRFIELLQNNSLRT